MRLSFIVNRQKVSSVKKRLARELRQRMTAEEAMLWEHLRDSRMLGLRFRRQQVIEGFIVDFYAHPVGLAVEIDGEIHDRQKAYDTERDKVLNARGIRVLRFSNREVRDGLDEVLAGIAEVCLGRLES